MKKIILSFLATTISATGLLAQNVGIGTTTPAYPLTVQKEGNGIVQKGTSVEVGFATSATAGIVRTYTNNALQFTTGNNPTQMALTYTGRFGVGTATPSTKMEVAHNQFDLFQLTNTTPLAAGQMTMMTFRNGSSYTGSITTYGLSATQARLGLAAGPSLIERVSIINNVGVGINNTNPTYPLDVTGDTRIVGDLSVYGAMSYGLCFEYTVDASDISANGKYVIIDDPALNGRSGLKVFVTRAGNPSDDFPVRAGYDDVAGKWRLQTNGQYIGGITSIGYEDCNGNCKSLTMPVLKDCKFTGSERFNIVAFY